ncbi:MAG: MCP four helix bundle domain-containing protein [Acidobacteria bacterium]|nr:MCP four helix bundle domain-containing protein [Acidobacteriota bacterium]
MLLLAGFGTMLLLILVSGLESVRITETIRERETLGHSRFLEGERVLYDIRANLLWSSIWMGDFLQSRTETTDDFYRRQLWGIRQELQIARTQQAMLLLTAEQVEIWNRLQVQVEDFWAMLEPVLQWSQQGKLRQGGRFLREEVIPRRAAILQITEELTKLNRQVLDNQNAEIARMAREFRIRMIVHVVLSTLLGAAVALWTMRYARRLEARLQEQYQESVTAKSNLERLSAKVVEAQEEERRAISRELHDQIGQALTAIKVNLGMVEQKTTGVSPELRERMRESKQLVEQCMQEIRDLSRLLRPTMLDDLGLVPALEWYVRGFSRRFGIPVSLEIDPNLGRLPEQWETSVYRSVQEALTNTIRHSEATKVFIHLEQTAESLLLTVEDNGQGFEFNSPKGGLGLIGMSERARQMGGMLSVESKQQAGTRIRVTLPLPPPAAVPEESASEVIS